VQIYCLVLQLIFLDKLFVGSEIKKYG